MQLSVKFAILAFIAQVAVVSASPIDDPTASSDMKIAARGPTERPTQRECEAFCSSIGLLGQQWQECVDHCVGGNYPSPPPSPHHSKPQKPNVPSRRPGRPGVKVARAPTTRPTQRECEDFCDSIGLFGAQWQQCVDHCVSGNYPSPPPSPHHSKPQNPQKPNVPSKRPGRPGVKVARAPTIRPTQRECEAFCSSIGLLGQQWQECVDHCVGGNYPSPPPSPHHSKPQNPQMPNVPSKRPGRSGVKVARAPTTRPTQRECEDFCDSIGLVGQQWQQCVDHCVSGNYPSPPPSPHHSKPQMPQMPSKRPAMKPSKPFRARDAQDEE